MKKQVDIEKLVQWALREELPKGRAVSTSAWDLIASYAVLGTRVDTSRGGDYDGLGFVPGTPHPDAGVIAYAIEMLPADVRFEDRIEVEALFGDLVGIAGDAIDAIMFATFNQRAIVLSKAVLGTRPKWDFENPTPHRMTLPFRNARGELRDRPRVIGTDANGDIVDIEPRRGRAAMRDGVYDLSLSPRSPIEWNDPAMISIGHARAEYIAWHNALSRLARDLAGRLEGHDALSPSAARVPWISGQTAAPRVLVSDNANHVGGPLPLQPKRQAGKAPSRESPDARDRRLAAAAAAALRQREEMA